MASDGKLKFYYFNCRARGEITMLIFAVAKADYELVTIDWDNEWPTFKKSK